MATQRFEVEARSDAPPDVVFAVLADAPRWREWAGPLVRTSSWEREGVPAPGGVGSIRRLGREPMVGREQILEHDPPHLLAYTVLSGIPVKNYRADVMFDPDGGGTLIRWRATFEPKVPGTGAVMRRVIAALIGDYARRLAAHAATRP